MKLKKLLFAAVISIFFPLTTLAQQENPNPPSDEYFRARVLQIVDEGKIEGELGSSNDYQELEVEILTGDEKGEIVQLTHGGNFSLQESQKVQEGQVVSLSKSYGYGDEAFYYINELYRLNRVIYFALGFFALAFILAGWRGLASLGGLAISLLVIVKWTLPQILEGKNPFLISFITTVVIAVSSLYLAHGFNRRTSIALGSTLLTVLIALLLAVFGVELLNLQGTGSEAAFSLQFSGLGDLNLQGLFLGGMIIGTLGVLDDVTTTQAATVDQLHQANPKMTRKQLWKRSMEVGKEHIVSIINTLVLAYAGGSLALLVLFYLNDQLPLWVILNNEAMVEEIMRTLIGSSALLFAVPITTGLAVWRMKKD